MVRCTTNLHLVAYPELYEEFSCHEYCEYRAYSPGIRPISAIIKKIIMHNL